MTHPKVDRFLAALFPRQCVLCRQPSGALNCCPGCYDDLPWILSPCMLCGAPLPADYPPDYQGGACSACVLSMQAIDRVLSALIYEYPVDRLVALAKFRARPDSAHALGELLGRHLLALAAKGSLDLPDLILPVPLHRRRLAQRGFNQALEIARPVGDALGLPLTSGACRRDRNTIAQTELTGRARYRNTKDAFRATADLSGRYVALIDDVITTGSTMNAMACALRAAGATRIQAWSVARTTRK